MSKKNLIIVLGEDEITLSAARSLAHNHLKNHEIRPLKKNVFWGLTREDVARITVVGHANTRNYGSFNPEAFTSAFDRALKYAKEHYDSKIEKEDIKGLRCFGCELGLKDKNGISYAQTLSNQFALQDYKLQLSAFTNKNKTLSHMGVSISSKGRAAVVGVKSSNGKKYDDLHELQEKTSQRIQAAKRVNGRFKSDAQTEKIKQLEKKEKSIERNLLKLHTILYEEKNPIQALDNKSMYRFPPLFTQKDISRLDEEIEECRTKRKNIINGDDPDELKRFYLKPYDERMCSLNIQKEKIPMFIAAQNQDDHQSQSKNKNQITQKLGSFIKAVQNFFKMFSSKSTAMGTMDEDVTLPDIKENSWVSSTSTMVSAMKPGPDALAAQVNSRHPQSDRPSSAETKLQKVQEATVSNYRVALKEFKNNQTSDPTEDKETVEVNCFRMR